MDLAGRMSLSRRSSAHRPAPSPHSLTSYPSSIRPPLRARRLARRRCAPTGIPSEFDLGFDDPGVFEEVIDVRVIHVETVVTRRGEPVHGLDADDFVLEVDGEPVPIEYFTEVRGGLSLVPAGPKQRSSSSVLIWSMTKIKYAVWF